MRPYTRDSVSLAIDFLTKVPPHVQLPNAIANEVVDIIMHGLHDLADFEYPDIPDIPLPEQSSGQILQG